MPHWLCTKGILYTISDDARVFIINSTEDLVYLRDNYGVGVNECYNASFDFEKMARDYDAINLTENGLIETRGNAIDIEHRVRLISWDCESTLILNERAISKTEPISLSKWIKEEEIEASIKEYKKW